MTSKLKKTEELFITFITKHNYNCHRYDINLNINIKVSTQLHYLLIKHSEVAHL